MTGKTLINGAIDSARLPETYRMPSAGIRIVAAASLLGVALVLSPRTAQAAEPIVKNAEQLRRIEEAVPKQAAVQPKEPRKLLVFCLNVGYGGHPSIHHANQAFTLMGEKTGAFETVISSDPAVFSKESLRQFDAVFFNNTVGNCFTNADLRQNLVEFVYGGGGLLGLHGTTVAFTQWPGALEDWPEFGLMLGARGANHRESTEHVFIKLDDRTHPVNRAFGGQDFDYRDEFFRVHEPYSRERVRVLLSIDNERTIANQGRGFGNVTRADGDYALAWVRHYGRGRVFYSTIAHNPYVFWDPKMLQFYMDAIQFALGDLDAPTIPSARVTPAVRAQEKLGWRLGIEAYTFHRHGLFEAMEKAAQLGLSYIGGLSFQKVSPEIAKNFDPDLSDEELKQVRFKLDAAGLRMLTYYIHDIPRDEAGCRKVFEFGRKMGIEVFLTEPKPEALDTIERFADEYDIRVALHNHDAKASPLYWSPDGILQVCEGRSKRMGACVDIGYWLRAGIDPIKGVQRLGDRLITIQMHDLNNVTPDGHDVIWGTGAGKTAELIREIHRLNVKPVMWGLEYSYNWLDSMPEVARCIEFFNNLALDLAE